MTLHPAYDNLTWKHKLQRFAKQCWRVLKVTKKPDRKEFTMLVKVSGLGIAAIGLLGFLIFMLKSTLLPF